MFEADSKDYDASLSQLDRTDVPRDRSGEHT